MASTTTNLGLTKPAYSDDADISDINGNMDLIDAEAGRVRANVAANYDSSETYAVGDYCLHDGSLYKCSTAISSPEAWTAGHWTQIKITGELSTLNANIANFVVTGADYPSSSMPKGIKLIQPTDDNQGYPSRYFPVISFIYEYNRGIQITATHQDFKYRVINNNAWTEWITIWQRS